MASSLQICAIRGLAVNSELCPCPFDDAEKASVVIKAMFYELVKAINTAGRPVPVEGDENVSLGGFEADAKMLRSFFLEGRVGGIAENRIRQECDQADE